MTRRWRWIDYGDWGSKGRRGRESLVVFLYPPPWPSSLEWYRRKGHGEESRLWREIHTVLEDAKTAAEAHVAEMEACRRLPIPAAAPPPDGHQLPRPAGEEICS